MSVTQIVIVLALTAYAVFQQTRRHQLNPKMRFKFAAIYGGIGLIVGGLALPTSATQVCFLVASVLLSIIVGGIRGLLTRIWTDGASWFSQGTALTVSIFLGMIVAKFGLGTLAYFTGVSDSGGIGEVLIMIGAMMALQAQIIHVRAQRMARSSAATMRKVTAADAMVAAN